MFVVYTSPIGRLAIDFDEGEDWQEVLRWLDDYFSGKKPVEIPAMNLCGTDFQLKVWNLLRQIPYGETTTYGELARQISPTMSAQAVGRAVGNNPCCILIPCHRVIGRDGSLIGYAHGLEMKRTLLEFERNTK